MSNVFIAVVAELLLKGFVEWKNRRYYMSAVQDSDLLASSNPGSQSTSSPSGSQYTAADPVVITVSNVPHGLSEQMLQMILENKRYGGGDMNWMKYSPSEHSATVEYADHAGSCATGYVARKYLTCPRC